MFATLVVVFPTPHEGGALILRHRDREWMFDSGRELAAASQSSIGYVAFFSDVEHEVAPVVSGHRVTLTYNLYFDDIIDTVSSPDVDTEKVSLPQITNEHSFHEMFQTLLENPEFLTDGGTLGFGLRHVYPIESPKRWNAKPLEPVYGALKGCDAIIYQAIHVLGFQPVLYMYYEWETPNGFLEAAVIDEAIDFSRHATGDMTVDITRVVRSEGGIVVCQEGWEIDEGVKCGEPEKVEWVTPATTINRQSSAFAAYGNEPSVEMVYADLCMFVRIGKAGERLVYPSVSQIEEERKRAGPTPSLNRWGSGGW
jgi:hypothetical protein